MSQENEKPIARKIILDLRECTALGDLVVLTGCLRDLQNSYPNFLFDIRTKCPEVFSALTHLVHLDENALDVETIVLSQDRCTEFNKNKNCFRNFDENIHFRHTIDVYVEQKTGLSIVWRSTRPCLPETFSVSNPVISKLNYSGPYWLINAGWYNEARSKFWGHDHFQKVIDFFKDKIQFIQIGAATDSHEPYKNTLSLVGQTSIIELACAVQSPKCHGTLSGVTGLAHVSAGYMKPAVVICGGVENSSFIRYPGQRLLDSIGFLPCCRGCGCTLSGHSTCANWRGDHTLCMNFVRPELVIEAILNYENLSKWDEKEKGKKS
jgi:ADP-heptose:LPS heptosyltransferase